MKQIPMLFSTPMERLLSKVREDANGCWNYSGYINPKGYGKFYLNDKVIMAHVASHILHGGVIPEGYTIDHLCKNRGCINPDHLEAVPHAVNLLRGDTLPAINKNKTHCNNGHEFNLDNTIVDSKGKRRCRICNLIWQKNKYQKIKNERATDSI